MCIAALQICFFLICISAFCTLSTVGGLLERYRTKWEKELKISFHFSQDLSLAAATSQGSRYSRVR
jgi:hypothetical protein